MCRALLILGLCVVAVGCNADPRCRRETALLRAEILDLEDQYYELKSKHELADAELKMFRNETGTEVIVSQGLIYEDQFPNSTIDRNGQPVEYAPQESIGPGFNLNGQPTYQTDPNSSEIIVPLEPETSPVGPSRSPDSFLNENSGVFLDGPDVSDLGPVQSEVAEIAIHRGLTRGQDVDGQPGDEGLELLIQPKNSDGEVVLQAGELTVSVIDPTAQGPQQRIGLWNFLPAESALFLANEDSNLRGILLHLPWGKSSPKHDELVVFVRFKTQDGRYFETSSHVRITPPRAGYLADDPLIADWSSGGNPAKLPDVDQRRRVQAIPASTGSGLPKPRWRPVR